MLPKSIYIDSSLLVLLVVGRTDKRLISKHRRLDTYQVEDYEHLLNFLRQIDHVLVTPNVLTEASNLLKQHGDPECSKFFRVLRILVAEWEETVVLSKVATSNCEFVRLGLTDAALLEVVSDSQPLITVDVGLYLAALHKGSEAAINFRHHQPSLQ